MRLLEYNLEVPVHVSAMDSYFHLMFRQVMPYVDRKGQITNDNIGRTSKTAITTILKKLTEQHPVKWTLKLVSMGIEYNVTAEKGQVSYVRVDKDGAS